MSRRTLVLINWSTMETEELRRATEEWIKRPNYRLAITQNLWYQLDFLQKGDTQLSERIGSDLLFFLRGMIREGWAIKQTIEEFLRNARIDAANNRIHMSRTMANDIQDYLWLGNDVIYLTAKPKVRDFIISKVSREATMNQVINGLYILKWTGDTV